MAFTPRTDTLNANIEVRCVEHVEANCCTCVQACLTRTPCLSDPDPVQVKLLLFLHVFSVVNMNLSPPVLLATVLDIKGNKPDASVTPIGK